MQKGRGSYHQHQRPRFEISAEKGICLAEGEFNALGNIDTPLHDLKEEEKHPRFMTSEVGKDARLQLTRPGPNQEYDIKRYTELALERASNKIKRAFNEFARKRDLDRTMAGSSFILPTH